MKNKEKAQITKEVFDLILANMRLHQIPFSKDNFKFALDMFLAGTNFIPTKTASSKVNLGERNT